MLFVVTGGSGSGKSEYAEGLACRLAARDGIPEKLYLATMKNQGEEAQTRIARHRSMRQGKGFLTVEVPMGFESTGIGANLLSGDHGRDCIVLLECMSNLLANLMFPEEADSAHLRDGRRAEEILLSQTRQAVSACRHLIVVTNEIFSDGQQYAGEMRDYLEALGRINRGLATMADSFCEVVYTIPVFLKGETLCRF